MARTVRFVKLDSRTARASPKLKRGRQANWQSLSAKVHLGYQRQKKGAGRWLLRRFLGNNRYRVVALGLADDVADADGTDILNYDMAKAKATAMIGTPNAGKVINLTVRQAMDRYIEWKVGLGETNAVADVRSRGAVHILPSLGDQVVSELSTETLRRWLATMANAPAQLRPTGNKLKFRASAETEEEIRKRRVSANRILTMLKAILNHAFDDEQVSNRDAWGRRLKPFKNVDAARVRWLEIAEAIRLVNACDEDFRSLVKAALQTGARYGELGRLLVEDFSSNSGTLHIRKSKTGKERHIHLTEEGTAFFLEHCAGRSRSERMFIRSNGEPWKKSQQQSRMIEACEIAKIEPTISFHILRHTYASHCVMNGIQLLAVAENLGHKGTKMVEKHYGHLAPTFKANMFRDHAPKYGFQIDKKVVPIR